jgi:RNA polymerase sigma-70 factor (ECF subfamily)
LNALAHNASGVTDLEWVKLSQQGDTTSFGHLYRRYQQRVRSTLYQLCGSDLLDDLVQEVFLRVWKGLPKLRNSSYFSTWLYRITWNVANDSRRQWAKRPPTEADETSLGIAEAKPQDMPDLMQLHYQDLVQRGLQSLRLEHRVVLVLHDLEDIPQKEVANILDLPIGTVKSRLFYARQAIRDFFIEQGVWQ